MMFRLTRARRCRQQVRPGDDTGSLIFAMLLTLVGISLTALLIPMIISQIRVSQAVVYRMNALNAAQAGLNVALGRIRAANDGAGGGVLKDLPWGPLRGKVSAGGTSTYEVRIAYLSADPQGHVRPEVLIDPVADAWVSANDINCVASSGPSATPAFALFRAVGIQPATGTSTTRRSLQATYTFHTTNENIAGGLIHVYGTANLCLDAGSSSPSSGQALTVKPCQNGAAQQTFAYTEKLNLVLVTSITAAPPGKCLDAGATHAAGNAVLFRPCGAGTVAQQKWSLNDSSNFEGTNASLGLDGFCFNVQPPTASGAAVVLGTGSNCNVSYNDRQTFSAEAAVGAGAAGSSTDQLVNFSQFGRCLDVPSKDATATYLIAWPCKQAPIASDVSWNQKWKLPAIPADALSATGQITTTPSSVYCLVSPGTKATGVYAKILPCPTGTKPANMVWTVYEDTGAYATSYVIRDNWGYCLTPIDPNIKPTDFYVNGQNVSKVTVADCSGLALQKWNAPPNILQSVPLKDIGEK